MYCSKITHLYEFLSYGHTWQGLGGRVPESEQCGRNQELLLKWTWRTFWICCQPEGNLALLLKHICVEAAVMINKTEETSKRHDSDISEDTDRDTLMERGTSCHRKTIRDHGPWITSPGVNIPLTDCGCDWSTPGQQQAWGSAAMGNACWNSGKQEARSRQRWIQTFCATLHLPKGTE